MQRKIKKNRADNHNLEVIRGGFDAIGDVAIIKPSKNLKLTRIKLLANSIMQKNKHIRGVFRKIGKIEGAERVQKLLWVCGSKNSLVLHKENGCYFYVDVKKVFFTPRLCSERLRISKLVKPKEIVLDMFCGVGPYAITIAKKAGEVYAIDINKCAIALLNKNIALNKVNNLKIFCGDSRKIVKRMNTKFDRIIMNFPLGAKGFLDAALKVTNKKCVIHLYTFLNAKKGYLGAVKSAKKEISLMINGHKLSKITAVRAGEVAPYIVRECFDLYLTD